MNFDKPKLGKDVFARDNANKDLIYSLLGMSGVVLVFTTLLFLIIYICTI